MHRICLFCFALPLLAAGPPASFSEHTIASDLKGGYQVVAADLNGDGKPDLIALASGMTELVWYENPAWQRHVIATGLSGMINCAVAMTRSEERTSELQSPCNLVCRLLLEKK